MKCFYHPELDAVATCLDCGKGLCQECAAAYTPCSCPDCVRIKASRAEAAHEKAKNDALIDTNAEFIGACIKGVIASVVIIALMVFTNDSRDPFTFGEYLLAGFLFFFFPYGWAFITWFRARFMPSLIVTPALFLILSVIKFAVSWIVGFPCFLYHVYRFIRGRMAVSQM